ncbi:MAG TPA: cupin domain-containing protein [Pyrinomonadaceae bacterium]|nr:cupin domain-containing protein [Pyrinomonadaceae bacterium]
MAVVLEGGCRVSEMREGEPLVEGTLRIWNRVGRATGAQAISLRVMEFAPGLSPGIRNEDCDEILYVLDGGLAAPRSDRDEVSTTRVSGWVNAFIDGHSYNIDRDTGIYLRPGETLAIDNSGPDPIVLISSQCPDPDRAPQFVAAMTTPSADSSPPDRPPLVRLADRPAQPTADRWYRVLVDDEIGSTQVTQFVGSIPPGRAPDHFHNYEEVLFILKGEGQMWAGETNTPVAPGSCIYLPKGQVHCVENTGRDELRLLGVFYPAGSPSVRYDAGALID